MKTIDTFSVADEILDSFILKSEYIYCYYLLNKKILSAGTVDIRPCKKIRFDSVRMCF